MRIRWIVVVGLLVLLAVLTQCSLVTSPAVTVAIPAEQARRDLAYLDTVHDRLARLFARLCETSQLDATACLDLDQAEAQYQEVSIELETLVGHPGVTIDWAKIDRLVTLLAGIAAKIPK